MFSDGFSVVDVRDRAQSEDRRFRRRAEEYPLAPSANPRRHPARRQRPEYLGDAAICTARPTITRKSLADSVQTEQPFAAGMRVFDISQPASPREIGFLDMPGLGAHRIWWVGGRYAYVSVHFEGFIDHVLAVVDVSRPDKADARRPLVAAGHAPRRRRDAARLVRQAHGAASPHQRRRSRLRRLARWRLHRSRSERSGPSETAQLIATTRRPSAAARIRRCRCPAASSWCSPTRRPRPIAPMGLPIPGSIDVREPANPVYDRHAADADRARISAPRAANSARTICMRTGPGSLQSSEIDLRHLSQCRLARVRHRATRSSPRRSPISCRRRRNASSISGRTRPR